MKLNVYMYTLFVLRVHCTMKLNVLCVVYKDTVILIALSWTWSRFSRLSELNKKNHKWLNFRQILKTIFISFYDILITHWSGILKANL